MFQDAGAAAAKPLRPPPQATATPASPPAETPAPPRRVRPLDLPPPSPPAALRVTPLTLPERAASVAPPSPVKAVVLPDPAPPVAATARYAPASLLFDEGKGSDLERLKRKAIESFPAISARQLEALDEVMRDLLPVEVSNLAAWGNAVLRRIEAMSAELQAHGATVASWNVGELIEKCHQVMGASGLWKIIRRSSPGSLKPALELILAQVPPMLAALDDLAQRFAPCRDVLAASLLLLKVAPQVLALRDIEAEALARRGHLLTVSAQHFDLLEPQLEQLRRQVIAWQSEVEQLVRVTIPVWELANGRPGGRP
ncbi:hypothetical protein [Accumulibacter sp.]|uniref:hypothetical protein n=1 Tax=Accumulibacter sp. TaxID=2053492 RepID=UPI002636925D|nr:hypothetical protein [Accumulibacter sp.]